MRQAAWYRKELPTFADALAAVRRELWQATTIDMSATDTDIHKLPFRLLERFADTLCYAA